MHSRFILSSTCALILAGTAAAQISSAKMKPITTTIQDAGTYHLATGTWTRGLGNAALAGPEVLYDNTCTTGYMWGMADGDVMWDSGRIPSTSSPSNASSLTGLYDCYTIDGFTIGYCSYEPFVTNLRVSFTDNYAACDDAGTLPVPIQVIDLVSVPAGGLGGGIGCWIINVDLSNTTLGFDLGGDANGNYSDQESRDSFGWSWTQTIPTTGSYSGPIFAGDSQGFFANSFLSCGGIGGGTTFPGAGPGPGNGIGSLDKIEIGGGPTNPGCYWFGGYSAANPHASFYFQVQGGEGNQCGFLNSGDPFCFGDGLGTACPCNNSGGQDQGCANQTGVGATLVGGGDASFSADTLSFRISGMDGARPGLLLRADNQLGGGNGVPMGDGLLCVGGNSQRSQTVVADSNGNAMISDFQGNPFGATANPLGAPTQYQWWYRDSVGSPCGTDFNFSNAWTVTYIP